MFVFPVFQVIFFVDDFTKFTVPSQLIGDERFRAVDKIKTIGSTYMAAVGLIPEYKIADEKEDGGLSAMTYMTQLVEYIFGKNES